MCSTVVCIVVGKVIVVVTVLQLVTVLAEQPIVVALPTILRGTLLDKELLVKGLLDPGLIGYVLPVALCMAA